MLLPTIRLFCFRQLLVVVNYFLIFAIYLRRKIVTQIQKIKKSQGKKVYHPQQEVKVANRLRPIIPLLSHKELLIFSKLQETHAGGDYPKWSEKAPYVNPHLLAIFQDQLKEEEHEQK